MRPNVVKHSHVIGTMNFNHMVCYHTSFKIFQIFLNYIQNSKDFNNLQVLLSNHVGSFHI